MCCIFSGGVGDCGLFLTHVLYLFPGKVYIYIYIYIYIYMYVCMYIYILRHLLEILNMDRNIKAMHCKRFLNLFAPQ